jgi:hypothetical protein
MQFGVCFHMATVDVLEREGAVDANRFDVLEREGAVDANR